MWPYAVCGVCGSAALQCHGVVVRLPVQAGPATGARVHVSAAAYRSDITGLLGVVACAPAF